ncbi:MAG: hypothetical protein ACYCW6_11715 [Candidatus Xenobia bacterium]
MIQVVASPPASVPSRPATPAPTSSVVVDTVRLQDAQEREATARHNIATMRVVAKTGMFAFYGSMAAEVANMAGLAAIPSGLVLLGMAGGLTTAYCAAKHGMTQIAALHQAQQDEAAARRTP